MGILTNTHNGLNFISDTKITYDYSTDVLNMSTAGDVSIGAATDTNYKLVVGGDTKTDGSFTSLGFVQSFGILYSRSNQAVLNQAGDGWNTWATRTSAGKLTLGNIDNLNMSGSLIVDGSITVNNGSDIVTSGEVTANNTQKSYVFTGGDQDKFYPIVLESSMNSAAAIHYFTLTQGSQSGSDPYNYNSLFGTANGQGWSDMAAHYNVFHNRYQDAEKNILGIFRGTRSTTDKVYIYVRGGENWYLRTSSAASRSLTGSEHPNGGNYTNAAVKDVNGSDVSGQSFASAHLSQMVSLQNANGGGTYQSHDCFSNKFASLSNNSYYLSPSTQALSLKTYGPAHLGIGISKNNTSLKLQNSSLATTNGAVYDSYQELLFVSGSADSVPAGIRHYANVWQNSDSALAFWTSQHGGSYAERMRVDGDGNVGIADTTPSYRLDVNGTIRATGDVIAYSDKRVKENIKTIENSLQKVNKLRGVEFNKIGEEVKSIGVIAQEIEEVIPEVVKTDDNGFKSVAYGNITGLLIEAIKDLKEEVDKLKNK